MKHDSENERIQRLCQQSGCTTSQGEYALEQSKGSLLSALLYLESQDICRPPSHPNGGFYSTQGFLPTPEEKPSQSPQKPLKSFCNAMKRELFSNYFELWQQEQFLTRIHVLVVLLLFPLTFGSLMIVMILPMFFGIYYRFSYEGTFLAEFNPILRRASNSLYDLAKKFSKGRG